MSDNVLQPETLMDLQLHIDRLNHTAEDCRAALRRMRGGELSREDYQRLLRRQLEAQRAWEARNREYFAPAD